MIEALKNEHHWLHLKATNAATETLCGDVIIPPSSKAVLAKRRTVKRLEHKLCEGCLKVYDEITD